MKAEIYAKDPGGIYRRVEGLSHRDGGEERKRSSEWTAVKNSCEPFRKKNGEALSVRRNGESSIKQPGKSERESLVERWR